MQMKGLVSSVNFTLAVCLSLTNVVPCFFPIAAAANSTTSSVQAKQYGRGRVPGRARGGGSRGICPSVGTELTAIVPSTTEATAQGLPVTYVGGVTTAERPNLWFYVPYTLSAELTADFILQDETGTTVFQLSSTEFSASEQTPGLVKVVLPELAVGKVYQWYFQINCGADSPIYTQGGIERIPLDPTLDSQLAAASPQQQAEIYRNNDLTYDAITILAELHREQPTDTTITTMWNELLQSINITEIPIVASP